MRLQPEQIDHINLVNWFNYQYPDYIDDFHHFANERHCSIAQGRLLKRMGVKKGVSDFFLALSREDYHGLWIELKVGKGRLSKEQTNFIYQKNRRGYVAVAAWGFEAAKELINSYMNNNITECYLNELPNMCINRPIC